MPHDAQPDDRFDQYLTRHYSRLGDQAKHREGRKLDLRRTYRHLLPPDRDAAILEIGPGYGQLLELLRRDIGYRHATAVDVSQEVVEFCNALAPGSTLQVTDTAAHLRGRPGTLDCVFAMHVLEHVPRTVALDLLQAVHGALKPGGRLVVEVPNMANLLTGTYLRYADLTHETGYTDSSLHQLLDSAGFEDIRCFDDQVAGAGWKGFLARAFRSTARLVQCAIYKGYQIPIPAVLTPALCATAIRRPQTP